MSPVGKTEPAPDNVQANTTIELTFLLREGYPGDGQGIVLMRLSDQKATSDPYAWPDVNHDSRTMPVAHNWIIDHWTEIQSGQVVDVRVILGEATEPATAEIMK